jgi:hypothetical protein
MLKDKQHEYFIVETIKYDGIVPMTIGIEIGGRMKGCIKITVNNIEYVPKVLQLSGHRDSPSTLPPASRL